MDDRQTFRSPFAVVTWWLWVLFAAGNLIDLAVQGRDHFSVVAAFILVLVTGVAYATAQRPRIVAGDEGLVIVNPLREHRIGWAAVAAVEAADLVRVRCEWPLGGGQGAGGTGRRVIYSWALYSSPRRQVSERLRAGSARSGPRRRPGPWLPSGAAGGEAPGPAAGDVGPVVAALSTHAEQARTTAPGQRARPPVSAWYWPALAAVAIPALALVVAIWALLRGGLTREAGLHRPTAGCRAVPAASPRSRPARRP